MFSDSGCVGKQSLLAEKWTKPRTSQFSWPQTDSHSSPVLAVPAGLCLMNKSTCWASLKTLIYSFADGMVAARCDYTARTDAILRPACAECSGGAFSYLAVEPNAMIRLTVLALIILLVVMAVTNPNQDTHRKTVYESVAASKTHSEVLGKITVDVLGNTDVLPLTYNNYYLFSTTSFKGQTASVGVFSRVWTKK
jgi:hypothetical protein